MLNPRYGVQKKKTMKELGEGKPTENLMIVELQQLINDAFNKKTMYESFEMVRVDRI